MNNLIYITPRDNPEYYYRQVLNDVNHNFSGITSGLTSFLNLSGGTVTGITNFIAGLSASTFSASTLYSGSTNLYDIFLSTQSGATVAGNFLSISGGTVTGLTNFISGLSASTLSAGTIYSGSTDLYDIFLTAAGANDITRVQPGLNTYTGGTANEPTINISAATLSSLSATTVSGGTLYSGSTNLYSIFSTTDTNDVTRVQPGLNIYTGGTANEPTINIGGGNFTASTFTTISSTTVSALTYTLLENTGQTAGAGTLLLIAANQQGFLVPHIYDSQGNQIEITRDDITIFRNTTGALISKGQVLYVTGSTGSVPTVGLALANSLSKLPAVAIAYENVSNNSFGRMMIVGNLENINLSSYNSGDLLYVSPITPGALTNTKPVYPNYAQSIGIVLNNGVGNGILQVFIRVVEGVHDGDSPIFNSLSATTIYSGSTNLYSIFSTTDTNDITRVQPGLNTYTGGTVNEPTINISAATLSSLSATTISGGTLYSGSTNLYSIFSTTDTNDITRVQPGLNTYTGGTANEPTINISAATLSSLSATTVSGGTLYSGSTNLYSIFSTSNDITRVQPGLNTYTGGTANAPTINVSGGTFDFISASTAYTTTLILTSPNGATWNVSITNTGAISTSQLTPPLSIPLTGLLVWCDASDSATIFANDNGTGAVANGGTVGYWGDISGNGNHLKQSSATSRPTWNTNQVNGLPSILFDGINDYLKATSFTLDRPEVVFIVLNRVALAGTVFDGNTGNSGRLFNNGGNLQIYAGDFGASLSQATGTYFIAKATIRASGSELAIDNGTPATSSNSQSSDMDGFTLAEFGTAGDPANIAVSEVIVYNRELTIGEEGIVWSYLGDKYGITV